MSMEALKTSATAMHAQEQKLNITANNLANMNTEGYKAQRLIFADLMYTDIGGVGTQTGSDGTINPTGIQIGHGVRAAGVTRLLEQGDTQMTESPLDVMIQGNGYLEFLLPDGTTAFSRVGALTLNADGRIVNLEGHPLVPDITVPQNAISVNISPEGDVNVLMPGQVQPQLVGTIELANFINPNGLLAIGGNLYSATPASGDPQTGTPGTDGRGSLLQAALESSNVKPVIEMVNLIESQRAYELASKGIKAADEMMQHVANI